MQGKLTIIAPDGTETVTTHTAPVNIDTLQSAVGGYIETVPFFTNFRGVECVVFCNEEGKIHGLPFNRKATELWREVEPRIGDVLLGSVAILTGDTEFMASL